MMPGWQPGGRLGGSPDGCSPLRRTFVAVDLETTGLDPERDAITEVGMVRFDEGGRELETFATFVNPGRDIPRFVQHLTGVRPEDVATAPRLAELADALVAFAGDDPVVGHNVEFDREHLRHGGIRLRGPSLDTKDFARLLMPGRQSHSLLDVAAELDVPVETYHRALADAQTAAYTFLALRRRAYELPDAQRLQLARLLSLHNPALASVLASPDEAEALRAEGPAVRAAPALPRLEPREPPEPVEGGQLKQAFEAAPVAMPGFEHRGQQVSMANRVLGALNDGGHVLVEAGTGVGKSLAYLLPAALYALKNGKRVVISTHTISLQEQLLKKDIPAVREMLLEAGIIEDDADFRAVLLKGRANYLCLQRWMASYGASMADPDFARLASSMLLWLPQTETGDRSELGLDQRDQLTWQRLSAQDAKCLSRQNSFVREGTCFLQRARKAAESAHIIVVNHALLLADVASDGSAIPSFDTLIIDEAHNLEDVATRQFGASASRRMLSDALDAVHRPGNREQRAGGVAEFLKAYPVQGGVTMLGQAIEEAVRRARGRLEPFFASLAPFVPKGNDDERVLVTGATHSSPDWTAVEEEAARLDEPLRSVVARAGEAAKLLATQEDDEAPSSLADEVESAAAQVEELRQRIHALLLPAGEDTIVWLARERDASVSLNSAPLHVGPLLSEQLFNECRTVVATSATLATGRDARYVARRLGMDEADFVQLGSPFDYESSTLLAAVTDVPEPNERGYIKGMAAAIARLVRASEGRALALFTSHAALRQVAEVLRVELEHDDIAVLAQGVDGPPPRLIQNLIEEPRTVVLGTASFWEGIDVKGEALSMLIIGRLPFAVPTDPVYQARAAQYERPFPEYALPSAVLRFRQGFGRLIRDRQDRGVVAVLDTRIFSKSYGRTFVEALPRCSMLKAEAEVVAERTLEWLSR